MSPNEEAPAMRKMIPGVATLLLTMSGLAIAQERDVQSLEGQTAPDFALKTLDGKDIRLSAEKGKVVLIDMWATWCPPCRKSLPHVQSLSSSRDLADKGLVVWAVNQQETPEAVGEFVHNNNYRFTIPLDADGKVGEAYLVRGIPTTVIVGRDGVVKSVFVGFGPEVVKPMDEAVDRALAEK
jgi:peroxiredoxin